MEDTSSTGSSLNMYMDSENDLKRIIKETPRSAVTKRCCGIRKMWLAAFSSLLLCLTVGLSSGYSAPATYDMQHRRGSAINPTDKEVMWIGSIIGLGLILGSLISGPMADKLGRKDTLVYNIVPAAFGWIIICYAESVAVLLFGRIINGIAVGIICCVAPMYCVEIATVEVRGILGSACQGFLVIGNLISVVIGAYMSWNYLALNGAVCSILAVIFFCPMPESPRWLLMKNRLPDAIKVMNYLQGGYVNAEKECAAIYKDLQNQPKGSVTWQELKRRSSMIPAILCLFVMFFQHFSGMNAVFLYSSSIFEVSKDFINPKVATVILAVVQVVATLLSNVTVDKAGRKILLVLSGGLMGISFAIFGFYYYKISLDKTFGDGHGWIPLTCCITAVIGYSVGYGPIPFFLTAEIVPVRVRSTINAVTHFANGLFAFIVTNTFSDVENLLKSYGAFWFYSSMSALGIIFVIVFLPETKGKTIDEIQDIFERKRNKTRQHINISVMKSSILVETTPIN